MGEAWRFKKKSVRPLSCESPIKILRLLVQKLAIRIQCGHEIHEIHPFVGIGKRGVIALISSRIMYNVLFVHASNHRVIANIAERS
jgi:hypothetical protein